jgi:uncharacterized membrane protein YgdD (TMEM256/DUF423 family)
MSASAPTRVFQRIVGALGGLCGALGVALGAYAAHAAEGRAQDWLQSAALYLLLHGLALLCLAPITQRRLGQGGLALMLLGLLLFCGSLIGAALLGWPTRLAPFGGSALILGWLLLGIDRLRSERGQRPSSRDPV